MSPSGIHGVESPPTVFTLGKEILMLSGVGEL